MAAAALTFTLSGAGKKSVRVEKILLAEQDLGDGMSPAKNSCGWGPACSEQTKAADGGITLGERRIMGTRHQEKPCVVACSQPRPRALALADLSGDGPPAVLTAAMRGVLVTLSPRRSPQP